MVAETDAVIDIVCPNCGAVNRAPAERLEARQKPKCGRCRSAMFNGEPVSFGSAEMFEKHVRGNGIPVLVDFWASWCGPCLAMAPQFAAAAQEMEPLVRFAKLDTEAVPQIAGRLNIRGIPTLILFRGGREIARQSGLMERPAIVGWVKQALG